MSAILGDCGCCDSGPGDDDEPPPDVFPPGDDPDPTWTSGYYFALKRAQIVRDGFPDLRTYYKSIAYDTGERFLTFDELAQVGTGSLHDRREFFSLAERLNTQGEFAPFDAYFILSGVPYNPADCRNTKMFEGTTTPGWPYASHYRLSGGHGGTADSISFVQGAFTVNASAGSSVPESVLNLIDDKLDVVQYLASRIKIGFQLNPSAVTAVPVSDGPRSGTRWQCAAVPSSPDFYDGGTVLFVNAGKVLHAFKLTDRARGSTADNRDAWSGLKLATLKQKLQVGFKSAVPADPVIKTYRKFTVPDGFSLLGGRQPSEAQQVFGMKMPANAEFIQEEEISIAVDDLQDFDPADQEVYFFDGRPFLFPQALPTVDEVLTPLVTKARLWRVFQPTFQRFPPFAQISPLTVGTRWTHEDRCLKHEVCRSVNGGAESVVATIDANPEEWPTSNGFGIPGWGGFIDPESGFSQFPLGWEWTYYDTDVAAGNTYTYRVRGYYDAGRKSAYSAAYSVET